eukprot:UN32552
MEEEQGEPNLFAEPLEPFKHPVTQKPIRILDTFSTTDLGYKYDKLPKTPMQRLKEIPTIVLFRNCDVVSLEQTSFELHVFLLPENKKLNIDKKNRFSWKKDKYYCGWVALFGGKGARCKNCKRSQPVNRTLEVTQKLRELKLSRHSAQIKVLTIRHPPDEPGIYYDFLEDLDKKQYKIPKPYITGPLFEDYKENLDLSCHDKHDKHTLGDVCALQKYLAKYGYYKGALDGDFGKITDDACRTFQRFTHLKVDGIAGPKTKALLHKPRFDQRIDLEKDKKNYVGQSSISYWVGTFPGYMNREKALNELAQAFHEW